jgi:hypothetical protein
MLPIFWRPPNLKFNRNNHALNVIFTIRHLVLCLFAILHFLILQHLSLPFCSVMCVISSDIYLYIYVYIYIYHAVNKLHVFSRTHHRFIFIKIVPFNMCYIFRPVGTIWIKINLCCFRVNKCSLFCDKHNGLVYIKIYIVPFSLFTFYYLFVRPTFIFARSANDNTLFPAVHIPSLNFTFSITFYYVFCACNL